ncbi:MAG: TIM-barrel domain-containing protein, partial [Vicinamibacterales bacterium]
MNRRDALRTLGMASAGVVLAPGQLRAQRVPIEVAGRPVEVAVASVSPSTVRLSVLPLDNSMARPVRNEGALVAASAGRELARQREVFSPVRAGNLRVRLAADPTTLVVETANGISIQRFRIDEKTSRIAFSPGKGPLLGFGEGGPQFDRKGSTYTNRNGQAGYQLRTHGGRVPIQWLVSTDGWGLYIHRPLGAFDLTGPEGLLTPASDALPLDVFVTASADPKEILREYARITGFAELPPLWSFGYMQSHRTLAGPGEINWVARSFRE